LGGWNCILVGISPLRYLTLLMWLDSCRYTFCALFGAQIIAASALSRYWSISQIVQDVTINVFGPGVILIINFQNVWVGDESHLSGP
jgi:hypothetical protein